MPKIRWSDGFKWLLGRGFEYRDGATHAIQPLVTLFTVLLIQIVAAIINEQGKGVRSSFLVLYGGLGASSILVLLVISRVRGSNAATANKLAGNTMGPGSNSYCYDRGTLVTGNWIVCLGAVLLGLTLGFGSCNKLPGQKPLAIGTPSVQPKDDVTVELPGLQFHFLLSDQNFGGTMPKEAVLVTYFEQDTNDKWRIVSSGARVEQYANGLRQPTQAEPTVNRDPDSRGPTEIRIGGLSSGPLYCVTVYLEPKSDEFETDVKKMAELMNDTGDQAQAEDELKVKWKRRAASAAREIGNRVEAVRVTVKS